MSPRLDDYSYQPLPDLGTGSRHPPEGRGRVELSYDPGDLTGIYFRASFAKVLLLYLDSNDFLFADGLSTRVPFRAKTSTDPKAPVSFEAFARDLEEQVRTGHGVDEEEVASSWGMKPGQDPFPAVFHRDESLPANSISSPLVLHANPATNIMSLHYSTSLLAEHSADILLNQIHQTWIFFSSTAGSASPITTPLSLPRSLMSAYEPLYDDSKAVLTLSWLMTNARERPDGIAHEIYTTHGLDHPPDILTYKDLNEGSNRLARWLIRRRGLVVGRQDRVAVCRNRDVNFYTAHAGIWKAGGCYVSIDPDLPPERKRYIASDSEALLVITTSDQASVFGERAVVLDDPHVQDEINAEDDSEDVCHAELDQLAYLLYTSGTTGTPKGCLLNHRGLYWAIEAMCLYPAKVTDPSTDKRLALASIAFDVHISEITQTWRLGIRLVSGQRYELLADLKGVITGIGITHLGMVPSMIEATLTGEEEKLKYLLLKKWANHPRVILANFYGPTEATVGCTSRRVSPTDRKENIGKPFESCHAYIVDPKNDLKMVPRGTPGELLVCGPLVGVGYIGLPQVTKKVFVEYEGKRGYRTGDLVRMMPDGSLEIMGRIDTQIKLRGVRIEAEGVSNVLRSALDVEVDAATMIATHPELSASSELLVSFVAIHDSSITFQQRRTQVPPLITTEEMKATVKRMKNTAEKELAVYMRPSYIVPLGWLPLSMNGKVEAKVLKSLFGEMSVKELVAMQGGAGGYATTKEKKADRAPTRTELRVLGIIRKVCNDDKVSLSYQTNLFECGFDSLRFATLAGELRKEFSVRIEAAEVMERPVVEDVAARLTSAMSEDQDESKAVGPLADKAMVDAAEAVFSPSDIDVVLPLFPVQEGVLFKSMESPDSYVQHFIYRCAEGVDAGRVVSSWRAVLGRQQILRTVFVTDDTGALIQVVLRDGTVDVPGATTKIHLDEGFDGWFLRSEALNVSTRINEDLTTPLWAVNIYEDDSSDQSSYMVFSINHALYDGNAMPLLIKEFRAIYSSPTPAPSLPDPVPLSSVLSAIPPANDPQTKQFFLDHFATIKRRDATPIAREVDSEKEAVWMTYPLDGISLGDLKDKCNRDWHVTLQAFWAVAFAIAGREFFGWNLDAIFGVVRSGRSLPLDGIENAICPLVTVVPTHVAFENPNEMLKKTQGFVGESSKYEHVSLGQVQRWLGVKNLIDVLLSCRFDGGVKQKNIVEHLASSRAIPEFVFNMEMVMNPVADSVEARLSFITPQLPQEKVDSFLHRFEECVESLISGHESGLQLNLENGEPTLPLTSPEASLGSSDRPVDHKLESLLTNAVAEFLRVDVSSIHPTTSLTALGLSSIRAVSLGRVLTEQGIKVSAVDIIQADGIREIARRVVGVSTKDDSRAVQESIRWLASFKEQLLADLELSKLKLTEDDGLDISGCTALQTGMLAQTLNSGGQLYVHAFTCQLLPECDPQHLRAAWQSAVEQLDILRTSFHFVSSVGQWAQVVHSRSDFKWTSRNLTGSLDDIRSQFISSLSFKDETTFARPPVHFLHLMGSENYLIIVLHHALYDGIAIPKLFRRVRRLYRDLDVPSPVKFLPIADAILMQEKGGTKYWTSQLEGSRPCQIPRVSSTSGSEAAWRSSVSLNLSAGELRRFCRRYHVHPQCLGQAAWAKVLARKVGSPDVVFGQVISGRTLPDADDVIGPVFNTIPCRVAFTPRETNKQLVRSIHEWNTSGLPWQHASLRSIQRQLGTSNLFDTLFLYQPHSDVIADDPLWATVGRGEMQESKTQYAINVELHERADSFHIFASCASDVATHEGLVSLLNDLNDEFVQLVRMPNAAVLGAEDPLFSSNQSAPDTPTTKVEDIEDDSVMNSWTDEQHQLRKIIVDFVRLPPDAVTPATSLVSIGIDSICAIQVASLARRAGISISATQVARSTSVQELVSVLSSSRPEAVDRTHNLAVPAIPEKVASNVRSSLPSGIRDRIEQILPPSAGMIYYTATEAHANAFTYKVERSEDPGAISRRVRDTWRDLSLKHKILRSFLWETGEQEFRMVLCVSKTYDFEWTEFTIDSTDELAAVRQQARTLTSVPIVSDRPSTRLALLHGKRASYMIVSLHHAQYDGWSLPLLMKEFESFYSGEQATDVGGDVESFLGACSRDSGSLSEQETYWKQLFPSSYEPTLFPRSNLESRPSFLSLVRQFVGCFQSPQETQTLVFVSMTGLVKSLDRLQSKARTHNLPLQSILLACWALIQARWSSIDSSTFLLCHAGRSGIVPDVDVLAAPTVNYIPTRVVLARDKEDIVAIAKQIQNELSGRSPVVEQSRVSDIARWAGKPGEPLTNISVNVLRLPSNGGTEEAKEKPARIFQPVKFPYSARPSETSPGAKAFPEIQHDCQVEMYFHSSTNSIGMSIECKSELMSERQAEDVCREWGRLVENFGSS